MLGQFRSCQLRLSEVISGSVRLCQIRICFIRSGHFKLD
jgi:hypothetical protein